MISRRDNFRDAFTLMELLVVMAIIAVLAALLLPGLARSKATAQSTACRNNLHQLGTYLQMYVAANNCYPVNGRNDTHPASRADSVLFWTGKLAREEFNVSQPPTNYFEQRVWHCPSVQWSAIKLAGVAHNSAELINYGYNDDRYVGNALKDPAKMFGLQGHYSLKTKNITPIVESEVVAPSDMMAIGDGFEGNGLLRRCPIDFFQQWGNILTRHQGQANVVFCDAHIESPKLPFLFEDTSPAALTRWSRDHQPHL